jgi:dimeric dUTPase (all-alpha-NTP-PPase superfamily)
MRFNDNEWFFFYLSITAIGVGMLDKISSIFGCVLIFIGIFGMIIILLRSFQREQYSTIKTKIKSITNKSSNNPDHFIEINIEALKAHLINWIGYESYKNIIKKVILYRKSFETNVPVSVKYILYFDLEYNRETESTRTIFKEFIDTDKKLPITGDEFKNIYKKTAPSNHLNEWHLTDKKPEDVNEEFSFVLYP